MDVPVLLAVQGPSEPALVAAMNATDGLAVTRRCGDTAELLAAAGAQVGSVAVVSASHLGIDRVLVERLHRMGVRVVGVASPEDMERVSALGADATVDSGAGPAAVIAAVKGLGRRGAEAPPPPPLEAPSGGGQVVAVWGTAGAPGRTTVAVNLAHSLSAWGATALLDADTRAPSVAQVLGMLEESSGIAIAVRAATQGRLDDAALDVCLLDVGNVAVMSGLTRPDRWREVPAAGLDVVIGRCRARYDFTVVDVAGGWDPEDSGFETAFAPARNAAQEAVLRACDVLVIVGSADPVGMHRLVSLLADRPRVSGREIVVVTRVRPGVGGPAPAHAVREALARFAGVDQPVLIDDDRAGLDAALMAGEYLAVVARRSPAVRAFEDLARRVAGVPRRRERRRSARRQAGAA
ncbi:MAG: hypothetical protein GX427_05515 [Actinomycetales bacterium]|nr:hypothetical protein [Actinomycetales bacterium]